MKKILIAVSVISVVLFGACATTPGPSDTPGPTDTPGPGDTPGPSDTPGPDDTPGPSDTPGPGDMNLQEINGSGDIVESGIDVKDFSMVEVSGEGVLVIEQGDEEGLVIETDDNLLEYIEVSVSGETLKIENIVDEGYDLVPTDAIYYHLKIKELEELILPGIVAVICDSLQTSSLYLDMSGITDVELSGEVDILNISVDGIGTLEGGDFLSKECSISGTGTANIIISVSEILDIDFIGIGSIKYIGDPEVEKDVGTLVDVERID